MDVAAAAPEGPDPFDNNEGTPHDGDDDDDSVTAPPLPSPKMNRGSRAMFRRFVVRDTFSGVTVFSSPRYATKPVDANSAGTIPTALHLR